MDSKTLIKRAVNGKHKNLTYDPKDPAKALCQITHLSLESLQISKIENLETAHL